MTENTGEMNDEAIELFARTVVSSASEFNRGRITYLGGGAWGCSAACLEAAKLAERMESLHSPEVKADSRMVWNVVSRLLQMEPAPVQARRSCDECHCRH